MGNIILGTVPLLLITTLYPVPQLKDDDCHLLVSFGHFQMMTDAMTSLALSIWRTLFPFGKAGSIRSQSRNLLDSGGRLFIDPTPILSVKPGRKAFPKVLSNVDEQIASAVTQAMQRDDIHLPAYKKVKRKAIKIVGPIAVRLVGLLSFLKTRNNVSRVNHFAETMIAESVQFITEASGPERIRRIQENAGSILPVLLKKILPVPLSGIISLTLVKKLTKKWLGDVPENLYAVNQSLSGNVTTEMGLFIGDLADLARPHPALIRYLEDAADDHFYEHLNQVDGGPAFAHKLNEFMDRYGMRCPGEIDIANTRWRESPTKLVPSILAHIRSVEPGEHHEKFEQGTKKAQKAARDLLSQIRETRGGYFKAKLLSYLIKVFRNGMPLREHPKYIIVRHLDIYKQVILEEGNKLSEAGILNHKEDVFFLSLDELLAIEEEHFQEDAGQVVASRRKEFKDNQRLTPPHVMTSEGEVITGTQQSLNAPEGALVGTPVSSGVTEGYAKVVMKPEEADLNEGDIMIAPFTDPGWTPLFHAAKALVMEIGGMMTHGAVVAREYGIPAVVGIDDATKTIKNGDYIQVNGAMGYVEILREGTV